MKISDFQTTAFNTVALSLVLAALSGVTINAAGPLRSRAIVPERSSPPETRSANPVPSSQTCIQPDGSTLTIVVPPGQSLAPGCPPPPPPPSLPRNERVDTNSDQTIYGIKTFTQPIRADIRGRAATAGYFTGALSGDIAGTQTNTRVVNVGIRALPSIGFGITPSAAKIKYVDNDADAGDPRMDGSLAHPYQSLTEAAANVRDGDRLILHGSLSGYAVFAQGITLEGASDQQTIIYGSLVFNGYQSSTVRNIRVNCTSDTACVSNLTTGSSDLILDHVTVSQSLTGVAAEAVNGRIVAYSSQFSAPDGGAVKISNSDRAYSHFTDCDFIAGHGSAIEITNRASVEINGSRLKTNGNQPAVFANGASSVRVLHSRVNAHGTTFYIKNSYDILIAGSWLTSGGGGDAVVKFDNTPMLTFAVSANRRMIIGNYFRTGGFGTIGCAQPDEIYSAGNLLLDRAVAASSEEPVADVQSKIPIIIPPPPVLRRCTLLSLASF